MKADEETAPILESKPHLSDSRPPGYKERPANPERNEFFCQECNARITVSSHASADEFGHQRDCPHKRERGGR